MQLSQLRGTAKMVWKGGIMAGVGRAAPTLRLFLTCKTCPSAQGRSGIYSERWGRVQSPCYRYVKALKSTRCRLIQSRHFRRLPSLDISKSGSTVHYRDLLIDISVLRVCSSQSFLMAQSMLQTMSS